MGNEHLTPEQRELAEAAKKADKAKRLKEQNRRLNTDEKINKRTEFDVFDTE